MKYDRYIDRFFDENNFENIKIEDNGKEIEFEQVALVDYDEKSYVILHQVDKEDEYEVDVFLVDEEKDELTYIDDELLCESIFQVYYELLESEEE